MDENRKKALAQALGQIEKQFGKGSVMRMGDSQAAKDVEAVSTGSIGLDVALGIGGVAAFVFGSLVLIDTEQPGYGISLPLVLTVGIASAFLMVLIIGMALKSQRRPVVSGKEELLGARGLVLEDFSGEGRVRVHGEVWAARCDLPLHRKQSVRIAGRDGLVLKVMPIEEE